MLRTIAAALCAVIGVACATDYKPRKGGPDDPTAPESLVMPASRTLAPETLFPGESDKEPESQPGEMHMDHGDMSGMKMGDGGKAMGGMDQADGGMDMGGAHKQHSHERMHGKHKADAGTTMQMGGGEKDMDGMDMSDGGMK